jgi:hypothetical protein
MKMEYIVILACCSSQDDFSVLPAYQKLLRPEIQARFNKSWSGDRCLLRNIVFLGCLIND